MFEEVQYLDDDTGTVHDGETGTPLRVKRGIIKKNKLID